MLLVCWALLLSLPLRCGAFAEVAKSSPLGWGCCLLLSSVGLLVLLLPSLLLAGFLVVAAKSSSGGAALLRGSCLLLACSLQLAGGFLKPLFSGELVVLKTLLLMPPLWLEILTTFVLLWFPSFLAKLTMTGLLA